MKNAVRVAIVGLGKVAWRFDEEPGRAVIWTHLGAYEALAGEVEIVGACDALAEARAAFAVKRPNIPVFDDIAKMMAAADPEVISVCTPVDTHRQIVEAIASSASANVKAIWCEKPLAASVGDAEAAVAACERRGVVLVVSHVRRWSSLWRRFAARLANGEIGILRNLRVSMPNRLWSIGSHAVDLALMLGGNVRQVVYLDVPALAEDGEPARPALLAFQSGAYAAVQVTGRKDRLIVEVEAIGDKGRLRAREDTGEITFEPFEASRRFSGYFEPGAAQSEKLATLTEESPFVAAAAEVVALAREPSRPATCSGREALATMRVLDQLAA